MGYWGRVAQRALIEARSEIRLDAPVGIMTGIVVPVIAGLVVGLLTGSIAWGGIVGVCLLLLVGLSLFLTKMFSVPAALDSERLAALEAMETKFAEKAERAEKDKKAGQLMIFVDEAKAYQRKIATAECPSSGDIKSWIRNVRNYIKKDIGDALAFKFTDDTELDMKPNVTIGSSINRRAPKDYALLDRRIKRLSEIIEKFA